jgi:glycosyltransferase involved in cell wall biosynthesis
VRIALLHPTYWPEVRRGSERLAHDLGATLASRGHDVTLLTSHRARPRVSVEDGIRVLRSWRPPRLPGLHFYEDHVANVPAAALRLLGCGYEVAHALFPADAWAARWARRLGGPPYVFSIHGIVDRRYLVGRRHRIEMLREAAAGAAATSALSEAAAEPLRRYLIAPHPLVLPGGVASADYAGPVERAPEPTILCPASLGDWRKRADLLLEAFARLRARRPGVRLVLAGGRDPFSRADHRALPPGVETTAAEDTVSLAAAYRSAWATVLPSDDEAFGLVLVESLAAGTPVAAARSGACPEIVGDEEIGRLFCPGDPSDLTRAMEEVLELSLGEGIVGRCRHHAAGWDWSLVVERYEAAYRAAIFEGRR